MYSEIYSGKRVLVTGHTGFKGSWLSSWLLKMGAEVTGFALPPEYEHSHFELLGLEKMMRHITGDIRDFEALKSAFLETQPEFVFHLLPQVKLIKSAES